MDKYKLPETNAVKFEHDGKPHVRLPQDEFDNLIDHLLAWQSILISKEYKDKGIKGVELKTADSDDENDGEVNDG